MVHSITYYFFMPDERTSGSHCPRMQQYLCSAQLAHKRECPHGSRATVEADKLHICQTCPTSRWKSCSFRCWFIDVERTSPAAVAAEPSACHCRWSHESLTDQLGCRQQAATADLGCSEWGQACSRTSTLPGSSETRNQRQHLSSASSACSCIWQ